MQQAIVLHSKPYRENSYICQLLTEQDGRITVFARRNKNQAALTPFNLYSLNTQQGQGELFFVQQCELVKSFDHLQGVRLYSGLYMNELIAKLLHQVLQSQACLAWYLSCLEKLHNKNLAVEPTLRNFELELVEELGLTADYFHCAETGETLVDYVKYVFQPELGWIRTGKISTFSPVLTGYQIKQIGLRNWQEAEVLRQAKLFMRWWIDLLLSGKPLKSRALFKYRQR